MKILTSEFLFSAVKQSSLPRDGLPEIAFLGRSNVGKSSLINRLLNRKRLAQTSKSPGKTRTLNFFLVNGELLFVDLPGYGYARVSKTEHASWRKMAEGYLGNREPLCCALLLIDIRHRPTELDRHMMNWLSYSGLRTVVVTTKADKLSGSRRKGQVDMIRKELAVPAGHPVIPFSSSTGLGRDHVLKEIETALQETG